MNRTKVLKSTSNVFELASRLALRFQFKGSIGIEDLWDLSPAQLKAIYQDLKKQLPKDSTDDVFDDVFTSAPSIENKIIFLKIDIVLHIAGVKKAEALALKDAAISRLKNDKIDIIIAKKQDAELEDMSVEDLLKMKSE